jgi:hypothetical protein
VQYASRSSRRSSRIGLLAVVARTGLVAAAPLRSGGRWRFDHGAVVEQHLADRPEMQHIMVAVTTTMVTVELTTTRPGGPDYDYTAVSEVSLTGTA